MSLFLFIYADIAQIFNLTIDITRTDAYFFANGTQKTNDRGNPVSCYDVTLSRRWFKPWYVSFNEKFLISSSPVYLLAAIFTLPESFTQFPHCRVYF